MHKFSTNFLCGACNGLLLAAVVAFAGGIYYGTFGDGSQSASVKSWAFGYFGWMFSYFELKLQNYIKTRL